MTESEAGHDARLPVSSLTRIRRQAHRQVIDRVALHAILDDALIAHVGAVVDGHPVVLPMACARDGDSLLLHGSTGAGQLRACQGPQGVSVCVTHLDGLVVARSVFDNSMNYRSAVIFGVPQPLEGGAKVAALERLTDHLLPGRRREVRPSTPKELAATLVLRLSLAEASVKVRCGPATDPDDGEDPGVWAGVLPLRLCAGAPVPDAAAAKLAVPSSVQSARERAGVTGD